MEKLDASHSQGLKCYKLCAFSCICPSHLLATIAKIVRKANRQVNRRQCIQCNVGLENKPIRAPLLGLAKSSWCGFQVFRQNEFILNSCIKGEKEIRNVPFVYQHSRKHL